MMKRILAAAGMAVVFMSGFGSVASAQAVVAASEPASGTVITAVADPDFRFPAQSTITNHMSDSSLSSRSGAQALAIFTLPYTSTYSVSSSLATSSFYPVNGRICVHLKATGAFGSVVWVRPAFSDGTGATSGDINFPQNGTTYGYCWTGLRSGIGHSFILFHKSGPAPSVGNFSATAT